MTDENKLWVKDLLDRFGLPTVLLAALSFAVWRALVWGGENLMIPLVNKQVESLQKLDQSQEKITETQIKLNESIESVKRDVVQIKTLAEDTIKRQDANFDEVVTVLQSIDENLKSGAR